MTDLVITTSGEVDFGQSEPAEVHVWAGEADRVMMAFRPRPGVDRRVKGVVPRVGARAGRNDPCPCQSGKKRKRCCG